MIKSRGIDALINDNIIGSVLGMGAFLVGIINAGVGCFLVRLLPSIPSHPSYTIAAGIFAFFIGFTQFSVFSEVITSGVSTTFVCLAEDPAALQRTKPELYEKIRQTYPQIQYR
jgi:hypothetical protein